jgi:hypothetical protein
MAVVNVKLVCIELYTLILAPEAKSEIGHPANPDSLVVKVEPADEGTTPHINFTVPLTVVIVVKAVTKFIPFIVPTATLVVAKMIGAFADLKTAVGGI